MSRKRRGRHTSDGLKSLVDKTAPLEDEKGRYVPFCDYHCHYGKVLDINVCNIRKCFHYHKLYITNDTQVYKKQ